MRKVPEGDWLCTGCTALIASSPTSQPAERQCASPAPAAAFGSPLHDETDPAEPAEPESLPAADDVELLEASLL